MSGARRRVLIGLGAVMVSACAYPVTKSERVSETSAIYFTGELESAMVFVDGVAAGAATQYDGAAGVLEVSPGTHQVEVLRDGSSILSRDIFVGRGQRLEIRI